MKLLILLMTIISLLVTGCGNTLIPTTCPKVKPIPLIPNVNIVPNKDGTLGKLNTIKAKRLNDKLRLVEKYYFNNTTRIYNLRGIDETYKIF